MNVAELPALAALFICLGTVDVVKGYGLHPLIGLECSSGCHPDNAVCEESGECRCRAGWRGAMCDQCISFPGCLHGTCVKAWECICEPGWVGSQCNEDKKNWCSSEPCSGNSTCVETGEGGYLCICPDGYIGEHCQHKKGPCLTNGSPCQNGGTCTDSDGLDVHSTCICPPSFAGNFCEISTDKCEPNPCANGGLCTERATSYSCSCPPGFSGPTCNSSRLQPCISNPCLNGGSCIRRRGDGGVRCLCLPGFLGPLCSSFQDQRPQPKPRSSLLSGSLSPQHYSLPAHAFHKLLRSPDRELLKITLKETIHAPGPLSTHSQVICFVVLALLTCLVVLGTMGIIFFSRCEIWMANAKYSQLVRQQRDYLLRTTNGEEHTVNIILPEKIQLTSYGKHYSSI
ncbi:protein delta homolog 1 isoform X2 [Denticeps clupeoides]|uniref:protein delta homolog 1 isoform X2 n=1 Tax=Denticeps clupeoides TaxID=299321 RepID=UPI0010A3073A|nr:protein delta homolog 1 isoform X2 [Denticeps clupeoides]